MLEGVKKFAPHYLDIDYDGISDLVSSSDDSTSDTGDGEDEGEDEDESDGERRDGMEGGGRAKKGKNRKQGKAKV